MRVRDLVKIYGTGETAVLALNHVNVDIERGRFTAIMGPSGSGKSTFMHCLAGFESITSGSVVLDGVEIAGMSERNLTKLRRQRVGFIFQSFNLIPTLSAAENIRLPQDIAHERIDQDRFDAVVDALELRERLGHRPSELSGGQQQRVACARALMQSPTVLFADEPTGNLDSHSTDQVLMYLRRAVATFGQTVVMVTHEPQAASYADTVLFLIDGSVVAQLDAPTEDDILDSLASLDSSEERAMAGQPPLGAPMGLEPELAAMGGPMGGQPQPEPLPYTDVPAEYGDPYPPYVGYDPGGYPVVIPHVQPSSPDYVNQGEPPYGYDDYSGPVNYAAHGYPVDQEVAGAPDYPGQAVDPYYQGGYPEDGYGGQAPYGAQEGYPEGGVTGGQDGYPEDGSWRADGYDGRRDG